MILIDFSSIIHRMIHSSVAKVKPKKEDGKFITSSFVGLMKYDILQELFSIKQEHGSKFGDMIICLDKSSGGYWRNDVYPAYKAGRKAIRAESEINFQEVFEHVDALIDQLRTNLPWKVVEVQRAEADDIMLVLAKEFCKYEKVLIHSPDKDMIQAQRDTDNVFQYSALTRKWLVPENKHDHMDHWIQEHVCLGDAGDEVPKVVDHTEFSDSFLAFLKERGHDIKTPMDFKAAELSTDVKKELITSFDVYKLNRKGESTGVKDIYKDNRFGPTTLVKAIQEHGSLDRWLDSHPLYRPHYNRNFTLVMSEGIPVDIWNNIIIAHKEADVNYNDKAFADYLIENDLKSIQMNLSSVFKVQRELTAQDYGW